jgi:hypothetical protein
VGIRNCLDAVAKRIFLDRVGNRIRSWSKVRVARSVTSRYFVTYLRSVVLDVDKFKYI